MMFLHMPLHLLKVLIYLQNYVSPYLSCFLCLSLCRLLFSLLPSLCSSDKLSKQILRLSIINNFFVASLFWPGFILVWYSFKFYVDFSGWKSVGWYYSVQGFFYYLSWRNPHALLSSKIHFLYQSKVISTLRSIVLHGKPEVIMKRL